MTSVDSDNGATLTFYSGQSGLFNQSEMYQRAFLHWNRAATQGILLYYNIMDSITSALDVESIRIHMHFIIINIFIIYYYYYHIF